MSLYKKYRPQTFEEIVGNQTVVEGIQQLLKTKSKIPHAFLLSGPTGCGKTTIARLLAKELNCNGSDFREINFANNRGIDTARDIIRQAQFKPLEGDCIIFLIDECHKMTNDAQNAFLKITEDTPEKVFFIFATTEPEKLIGALKGRCSIFNVSTLHNSEMFRLLKRIAIKEGHKIEKEILKQIAEDSMGHPRNAINVLEQVINVDPEQRMEVAQRRAEELSQSFELCKAIVYKKSWKEVSFILDSLKKQNQDPEAIRRQILGYASGVLLKGKADAHCGAVLECFKDPYYNTGFPGLVLSCLSAIM